MRDSLLNHWTHWSSNAWRKWFGERPFGLTLEKWTFRLQFSIQQPATWWNTCCAPGTSWIICASRSGNKSKQLAWSMLRRSSMSWHVGTWGAMASNPTSAKQHEAETQDNTNHKTSTAPFYLEDKPAAIAKGHLPDGVLRKREDLGRAARMQTSSRSEKQWTHRTMHWYYTHWTVALVLHYYSMLTMVIPNH